MKFNNKDFNRKKAAPGVVVRRRKGESFEDLLRRFNDEIRFDYRRTLKFKPKPTHGNYPDKKEKYAGYHNNQ